MSRTMGMRVPMVQTPDGLRAVFDASQLPRDGRVWVQMDSDVLARWQLFFTWAEPDEPRDATPEEWAKRQPQDARPASMFRTPGFSVED